MQETSPELSLNSSWVPARPCSGGPGRSATAAAPPWFPPCCSCAPGSPVRMQDNAISALCVESCASLIMVRMPTLTTCTKQFACFRLPSYTRNPLFTCRCGGCKTAVNFRRLQGGVCFVKQPTAATAPLPPPFRTRSRCAAQTSTRQTREKGTTVARLRIGCTTIYHITSSCIGSRTGLAPGLKCHHEMRRRNSSTASTLMFHCVRPHRVSAGAILGDVWRDARERRHVAVAGLPLRGLCGRVTATVRVH